MTASPGNFLSLKAISRTLGLEESRLRYYEKVFAAVLPPKVAAGDQLVYPESATDIFRRLHRLATAGLEEKTIREQLGSYQEPGGQAGSGRLARVLTITSGKGGVGKSSVALNLAIALRQLGQKIVLIDGDLGLANLHLLAGVPARKTVATMIKMDLAILDIITTGPAGIAMIAGASGLAELADLPAYKRSRLLEQFADLERIADHIIIDTSSGLAPAVLDFLRLADEIMVVATPDITSLADAYGLIKTCRQENFPARIGIFTNQVLNLAQAAEIYRRLDSCCRQFLDFSPANLGYLYRDRSVEQAVRQRRPFILSPAKTRASFCLRQLAELLNQREFDIAGKKTPAFSRLQNLIREGRDDHQLSQLL